MAHNLNSLSELPFHDLNLDEYLKETGTWVIHPLFDNLLQYASSRHTYKTDMHLSKTSASHLLEPTWAKNCFRIRQQISGAIFLIM